MSDANVMVDVAHGALLEALLAWQDAHVKHFSQAAEYFGMSPTGWSLIRSRERRISYPQAVRIAGRVPEVAREAIAYQEAYLAAMRARAIGRGTSWLREEQAASVDDAD